ncbi:hypothetical protein D6D17_10500 [Aureobasidium pullulans]|nr:hypothetical protein D6D17_10500 [Aureobasidium pullulans]
MYDTAAIERWIAVSEPTCNSDRRDAGPGAKTSKRAYPTPDPESSFPSKRSCEEHRGVGPATSTDTGIPNDMMPDDGEIDAEATPRAALQGRPSRSAPPAPSLDFGAPEPTASMSPRSSAASSSSLSLVSSGSKRFRRSAMSSSSKEAMLRAIPSSINLRAFRDSDIDNKALLGFRNLVNQILDFAEGLGTDPAELKIGRSPTLADIDRIVGQAGKLREDGDSKAAYKSPVHGPVFALDLFYLIFHSSSPRARSGYSYFPPPGRRNNGRPT